MAVSHLVGHGGRHDQLHQVHPQLARAASGRAAAEEVGVARKDSGIFGVHAAVAVDGDADTQFLGQRHVVAELRDQERVLAAFHLHGTHGGRDGGAAPGIEQFGTQIPSVTDDGRLGRVVDTRKGVVRHGNGRPTHAFGLEAEAMREVAVGGPGGYGDRQQGGRSQGARSTVHFFHGSLLGVVGPVAVSVQNSPLEPRSIICQMVSRTAQASSLSGDGSLRPILTIMSMFSVYSQRLPSSCSTMLMRQGR